MELDFAMIATGADRSADGGHLHIFSGGFDTIGVGELPFQLPQISVVARFLETDPNPTLQNKFLLSVINPAGERKDLGEPLPFGFNEKSPNRKASFAIVIARVFLKVLSAGQYEFVISVDDVELKRIGLFIEVVGGETAV